MLEGPGISGYEAFAVPRRAEFDRILPSAVIGQDSHGHLVEINRMFSCSCSKFMASFTDDEFNRHMVARREILRGLCNVQSKKHGKKLYKTVSVIDADGLSLSHLSDKRFHARMKNFNGLFSWHYPESAYKVVVSQHTAQTGCLPDWTRPPPRTHSHSHALAPTCVPSSILDARDSIFWQVINAPRIFTALWAIAKHFVHPVTASKVTVVGHSYSKTFAELGVVFDEGLEMVGGKLPSNLPQWATRFATVKAEESLETITRGFLPDADLTGLATAPLASAPTSPALASTPAMSPRAELQLGP